MSVATNIIMIMLGINLLMFLFSLGADLESSACTYCSPLFAFASGLATGNWAAILTSLGSSAYVYIALLLLVVGASWATGGSPLSGGGYGAVLTLQILAIGIFASLGMLPNFAAMGMPIAIQIVLNVVFGGMILVAVIGLLRGND